MWTTDNRFYSLKTVQGYQLVLDMGVESVMDSHTDIGGGCDYTRI